MIACAHCDSAPERREDEATGRIMFICPVCKHRGEASTSEVYSAATWGKANARTLARHCSDGVPRFYQKGGEWGVRCTVCGQSGLTIETFEGAVACWLRFLR